MPTLLDRSSTSTLRPSAAHTGAVFVTVAGTALAHAPALAGEWIARLDALEARLADEHIAEIAIWDRMPYSDGVSVDHLRRVTSNVDVDDVAVDPAHLDEFLTSDHEVWTLGEAFAGGLDRIAFLSKEVWLDDS